MSAILLTDLARHQGIEAEDDKTIEGLGEKAEMGPGNDGIVLSKTKPIRGSDESRRKRRDLTEAIEAEVRLTWATLRQGKATSTITPKEVT